MSLCAGYKSAVIGGSNLVSVGCDPSSARLRLRSRPFSLLSGVFLRFPAHHCLRLYESVRPSGELPLMQSCPSAFERVCICARDSPLSFSLPVSSSVQSHHFPVAFELFLTSLYLNLLQSCKVSISAGIRLDVRPSFSYHKAQIFFLIYFLHMSQTSSRANFILYLRSLLSCVYFV